MSRLEAGLALDDFLTGVTQQHVLPCVPPSSAMPSDRNPHTQTGSQHATHPTPRTSTLIVNLSCALFQERDSGRFMSDQESLLRRVDELTQGMAARGEEAELSRAKLAAVQEQMLAGRGAQSALQVGACEPLFATLN